MDRDPPEPPAPRATAAPQQKTPVGPFAGMGVAPTPALPKGGGAIRDIGEKFSANAVTGTGSLSVPIATSPGRAGFHPDLALAYDSGAGVGVFGAGWHVSVPYITRKTDRGLPQYRDRQDSDVYILSGMEDLVPVLGANGKPGIFQDGNEQVERYRPRIEGAFARIERREQADGTVYWKAVTHDNITSFYGRTAATQVVDPDWSRRIFTWLLEETRDDRGNVIVYEYKPEDLVGVPQVVSERHRQNGNAHFANRHLKRIRYGNKVPRDTTSTLFEVVFDYGEHDPTTPTPEDTLPWPARQDSTSRYRAGFEVRNYRLCRRILMFHRFAELGATPCLVASTDLGYDENPVLTKLVSVTHTGYVRDASGSTYTRASLPPVIFGYSSSALHTRIQSFESSSLVGIPAGIDHRSQWVDLDGEGLPGVLVSNDDALSFKRNLGSGMLAPPRKLPVQPRGTDLADARQQLVDLEGDARKELAFWSFPTYGFHERTDEDGWGPWSPFRLQPMLDVRNPAVRFIDLTGDGREDILLVDDVSLTWFPSLGREGYGPPKRMSRGWNEEMCPPRALLTEATQAIVLADMTGDGLPDLVRVKNGSVCYWPNLGYGRFGARVTLANTPPFDRPERFDPRRLRFGDIDGTGTTDILYVHRDGIRLYANQSGNALAAPVGLPRFPSSDDGTTLSMVDVFGSGTACLVWSSPHQRHAADPMRYMDLHEGKKPHLLTSVSNSMGLTTTVDYASSTRFYLADLEAGEPWATKLPFPVQVLTRVETYDAVSKVRLVTTYSYHHGYYDGVEREFRGFGRVDQRDAESLSSALGQGLFLPSDQAPPGVELAVPPVLTKTWFHTGYWPKGASLATVFAKEYFQAGSSRPPSSVFTHRVLQGGSLTDLPLTLRGQDAREATRALKGQLLRQEVYAEDGSSLATVPYSVSERSYGVRLLQGSTGAAHGSFLVHPRETIDLRYERIVADPRVTHTFILQVDSYGAALQSAAVAYPRRNPIEPEQSALAVTLAETTVINADDQPAWYRLGVPLEARSYELTGLTSPTSGGTFTFDAVATAAANATVIQHEVEPNGSLQKRLLKEIRHVYWSDDQSAPLAFGELESLALPFQSYAKAFTPTRLAGAFGSRVTVTPAMLTEGGYVQLAGDDAWWIPSGRQGFSGAPTFYVPTAFFEPFGTPTVVTYDAYQMLVVQVTDALQNTVLSTNDYRVLGPVVVTDPNGNRSAASFDALGRLVATALMGKDGASEGDTLDDPTTKIAYELDRWTALGLPNRVHVSAREQHGPQNTRWQESYTYSDGSGHVVMTKAQAEPGEAYTVDAQGQVISVNASSRWVGTGRTVFDNKGNPVKKYEPYFSATFEYEDDGPLVTWGVTPILRYDPLGRLVRTDLPNGTYSKVVFDAWQEASWDPNDTVEGSLWFAARNGLDPSTGEGRAAQLAYAHRATPSVKHSDPQGRPFLVVQDNAGGALFKTRTNLDIEGNALVVTDALLRPVATAVFAMGGQVLRRSSVDAGQRWILNDVMGQPFRSWDGRDHAVRAVRDELRRSTHLFVQRGTHLEYPAERTVYGEALSGPEAMNARGRVYERYDGAGVATSLLYDFKGNLLRSKRRLARQYDVHIDWTPIRDLSVPADIASAAEPLLEPEAEAFPSQTNYDALNRPTSLITPDASEIRPTYNEAGLLARVVARVRNAPVWATFVDDIEHDAKGQRLQVAYGDDGHGNPTTTTTHVYDPLTFRMTRLKTTRASDGARLQNLGYTYDPVGNITEVSDGAQQTVFFANDMVVPAMAYVYDAVYRLLDATGRQQAGGSADMQRDQNDVPLMNLPHVNDAQAVRNYAESYEYDAVGNILRMVHSTNGPMNVGSWTRRYTVDPASNRLLGTSVPGDLSDQFSATYGYDAHGNMTSMPHLPHIGWDFKDQMHRTDLLGAGGTVYFTYDGAGQRVRKVWEYSGLIDERIYLGGYEVYRKRQAGAVVLERQTLHVMDGATRIALVETKTVDANAGGSFQVTTMTRFQLGNHLGSAVLELDVSGMVISYEEYHPYGTSAYRSGTSVVEVSRKRYRYTRKEKDEETGLYYHGARYYASWLGRWTAADPAGLVDGTNVFAYVRNSPLISVDATGKQGKPPGDDEIVGQTAEGGFIKANGEVVHGPYDEHAVAAPPPSAKTPTVTTLPAAPSGAHQLYSQMTGAPMDAPGWRPANEIAAEHLHAQGYHNLAWLAEQGFACTFCHLTKDYKSQQEANDAIDLSHLKATAAVMGTARFALQTVITVNQARGNAEAPPAQPGKGPVGASPKTFASHKYDDLDKAAKWITSKKGRFDVAIHGDKAAFWVKSGPGKHDWVEVSASRLARFMQKNGYRGGPVRLISCETGACAAGPAQNLADTLGEAVLAPTKKAFIHPDGRITVGNGPTDKSGAWQWFAPKNRGKR